MNLSMIMSRLLHLVHGCDEDVEFGRAMGAPLAKLGPMITHHMRNAAMDVLEEVGLTAAEFLSIVDECVDPKQAFFTFGPALHFIRDA